MFTSQTTVGGLVRGAAVGGRGASPALGGPAVCLCRPVRVFAPLRLVHPRLISLTRAMPAWAQALQRLSPGDEVSRSALGALARGSVATALPREPSAPPRPLPAPLPPPPSRTGHRWSVSVSPPVLHQLPAHVPSRPDVPVPGPHVPCLLCAVPAEPALCRALS